MKLLLDQGTPRSAAIILRSAGFDAVHTGEVDMATAEDSEIIDFAIRDNRLVVTLDADFHMLLALRKASKPSIIRFRIEVRAEEFCRILQNILLQCAEDLETGAMISVNDFQIRVRNLPIA